MSLPFTHPLIGRHTAPAARPASGDRGRLRHACKALARGLAAVLVLPLVLWFRVKAAVLGRDRALEGSSETLSLVPGLLGQYLRRAFLARVLVCCDPTAVIGFGTLFSKAGASIGPNVYIGPRCHIGLATIEADVLLAAGVHVTSGARTHGIANLSQPIRDQKGTPALVRIGRGVWVGSAAVVMADVGEDSVVGAGAVVSRPVPPRVVAAGVPARVLRAREDDSLQDQKDRR
jgi:virginiamycin A acetyltransferase